MPYINEQWQEMFWDKNNGTYRSNLLTDNFKKLFRISYSFLNLPISERIGFSFFPFVKNIGISLKLNTSITICEVLTSKYDHLLNHCIYCGSALAMVQWEHAKLLEKCPMLCRLDFVQWLNRSLIRSFIAAKVWQNKLFNFALWYKISFHLFQTVEKKDKNLNDDKYYQVHQMLYTLFTLIIYLSPQQFASTIHHV